MNEVSSASPADLYRRIERLALSTFAACARHGILPATAVPTSLTIEKPKRKEHGDFAMTACLSLARELKMSPRDLANGFLLHLDDAEGILEAAEIAGPGFINFRIRESVWRDVIADVPRLGTAYGRSDIGAGKKVLVEFVSANPTGPLHVGHGRGAVIGDAVASLLQAVGYTVEREYYINDVGNQMNILGRSLFVRYQQACGLDVPFPENHYQGDYVLPIAQAFKQKHGDAYVKTDYEANRRFFIDFIKDDILAGIQKDLGRLGVKFDRWFSEKSLHDQGRLLGVVDRMKTAGVIKVDDQGRHVFLSTTLGDDEDRIVIRENGVPTYFAADIAYHEEKFERGYDHCINVWGADHHGYIPRVKAAVSALGVDPDRLEILLYQFVSLVENGQQVRMSTRTGQFETLESLLEDVGEDVTRCTFLMRKSDSQFEFDLGLARTQSEDHPVFYVQFGHARICQIIEKASREGYTVPRATETDLTALTLPEELDLIKKSLDYPEVLRAAAAVRGPHHIIFYLQELISQFHTYYSKYAHSEKVVSSDAKKTGARLFLCDAVRIVVSNALQVLGVSAPQRM